MTKEKKVTPPDVYSLFHCAVAEMEAGHQLWRNNQYAQFIALLQTSATHLARALLAAKGNSASDDKPLTEQLSAVNDASGLDSPVYNNILDVLLFDAGTDENREGLKDIYKEYQSTLVNARKILVSDLNYNEKIWQKLKQTIITSTGLKRLSVVILSLIFLLILPMAIYHYVDPIDRYELDGQIFWKTKAKVPFTTKSSKRFPVISDNQSRDYMIALDSPVNIFLLRLDPVNAIGLTDVEIETISLLGPGDVLLRKIVFDNSMYWSCDNCIGLEKNSDTYRLRPTSNDPYLTSSAINQEGVNKIVIKMRVVAKKTFWEWILGIDKNMEF
jgi:hypothetical protein